MRDLGPLGALQQLASEVGVEVRVEPFELAMAGKGGLCRIRGKRVILVDARLGSLERAGVIGQALAKVIPADRHVPRDLLPYLRTGHARIAPLATTPPLRPLARARLRLV